MRSRREVPYSLLFARFTRNRSKRADGSKRGEGAVWCRGRQKPVECGSRARGFVMEKVGGYVDGCQRVVS